MEVLAFDSDEAVLELVVHFLGIATHDNINAAPSTFSKVQNGKKAEKPRNRAEPAPDPRPGRHVSHPHVTRRVDPALFQRSVRAN